MYHVYFPEELLALRQEIDNHPDLMVILAAQADPDIYIHIAEISAFCGVVLDGTYTQEEILKLCDILVKKLQAKRMIIVTDQMIH